MGGQPNEPIGDHRLSASCVVVERSDHHWSDGLVVIYQSTIRIVEASAESCALIYFHMLVEIRAWGNISKMTRDGAKRFGLEILYTLSTGAIRVRYGVWPGGTKMTNFVFV